MQPAVGFLPRLRKQTCGKARYGLCLQSSQKGRSRPIVLEQNKLGRVSFSILYSHVFRQKWFRFFESARTKPILEFICYWLPADLNHSFERPLKQFAKKSTPVLSSKPSSDFEILSPCDALHPICLFVRTAKNFFKKGLSQSLCFQFY